ncbi:hypothetical protein SSAG_05266 [Streptomyces sp. Mg1]|nr:hypothetical protein SSAG_05266 [Streptomyces sp. Mg1]
MSNLKPSTEIVSDPDQVGCIRQDEWPAAGFPGPTYPCSYQKKYRPS